MNKFIAKALVVLMTVQSLNTIAYAEDKSFEKNQLKLPKPTAEVFENVKQIQEDKDYVKRNNTYSATLEKEKSVNSIVYIPDQELKNFIKDALKIKNDNDITLESLKTIKALDIHSTEIYDLEGIQYCTSLESLYLSECKLNDISKISGLKNLKSLNLSLNNISDLTPIKGLTKLEFLDLQKCNISKSLGSLSNLTNLRTLNLSLCNINDITQLFKLVNLEKLQINNNDIKSVAGIENFKNLRELFLQSNNIMDFSTLAKVNIEGLYTSGQLLENIPIVFNGDKAVIKNPLINVDGSFMTIDNNENAQYDSVNNIITFKKNSNNNYYLEYHDSESSWGKMNFIPEYTNKVEEGPEIIVAEPITIFQGEQVDLLKGMKAIDKKDGDISTKINVNSSKLNVNTQGTYSITYSVTDSDNNTTTLTRTIFVQPYTAPTISNVEAVSLIKGDYFNPMAGVQVSCIDGMVSDKVKIEKNDYVDTNTTGKYTLTYSYTDRFGKTTTVKRGVTVTENKISVISIEGANRYETAAKLSSYIYESTDAVVIVNGGAMADGLCVTPLAAALNAPILLTGKDTLPQSTIDEIKRLGATYVLIAGGESVVAPSIVSQLQSIGISQIDRVGGANRYETSYMIANVIDQGITDVSQVVITNGKGQADALSIASAAAYNMMPIVLVEKDGIYDYAYYWMEEEALENAYIIGGTTVVDQGVMNLMNEITKADITNNRLGGANRYDTNAAVIDRFYKSGDNTMKVAFISKGNVLVDALASGAVACLFNGPVVLASDNLASSQVEVLTPYRGTYIVRVGGGIPNKAVETLSKCLE